MSHKDDDQLPFPEIATPTTPTTDTLPKPENDLGAAGASADEAVEFPTAKADESPVTAPASPASAGTTVVEFVGNLQALVGLAFNGLLSIETEQGRAMVLCFGTGIGNIGSFDIGVLLNQGSVIDMGDDVTDPASHHAAIQSSLSVPVETVDTITDSVGGTPIEVLRVKLANGRQIKIGGPGGMVLTADAAPQEPREP